MIKGWDDAPVVVVKNSITPKRVTFIYPFYRNPKFLRLQLDNWKSYPETVRNYISVIIVDDGSPEDKAEDVAELIVSNLNFRLFYIEVDIRFNWIAARNIAMHHAYDGWCLATDMDHVVPALTAEALVYGVHNSKYIHRLSRKDFGKGDIHPHPNSWFMTRKMFWKFGGYDEALSGYYGTDGEARRRWVKTAPIVTLKDHLVRYEYYQDSSTTNYLRKQPEDFEAQRLIKMRDKNWKPKVLSFPYHEVMVI
jgi:glycosyltransferase involved in cell wall biosynthesis